MRRGRWTSTLVMIQRVPIHHDQVGTVRLRDDIVQRIAVARDRSHGDAMASDQLSRALCKPCHSAISARDGDRWGTR